MKFCQFCGAQLQDEALFCGNCGTNLTQEKEQPVAQTYQQPVQQMYQQPVQQTYQQPVQQMYQQPVQQTYQQPVQQMYQQPVQQMYQQPVQPIYQQRPMAQGYQQPVRPNPSKPPKPAKSKKEKRIRTEKGYVIGYSILAIIFYLIVIIRNANHGIPFGTEALTIVISILTIIGVSIGKNNTLIGCAYCLKTPVRIIILIAIGSPISTVFNGFTLFEFISDILLALLFLSKKESIKKIYFLPCVLAALSSIIRVVVYEACLWDTFALSDNIIYSIFLELVLYSAGWLMVYCLGDIARVKWNVAPKNANGTPVNATNNHVRVAQNAPNMHQQPNNMNYQNNQGYQNQQNNVNYQNTQNYQNQ